MTKSLTPFWRWGFYVTLGKMSRFCNKFLCSNISLTVCQINEKNIREMRIRKVSQHNTSPGSGLADCHLKKPIRLNHLVWTKNSREDGSGYYFKSIVFTAAEAKNFNSTLVTSQWLKTKLAEHDLDLKSQAPQAKTRCTDQVAPETARKLRLPKCPRHL